MMFVEGGGVDGNNILRSLGPLYHEYSFFGVDNEQLPGIYALNQKSKMPIITAYIARAIALSRIRASDSVSFLEMFCADGYYAMVASRLGCNRCIGIDSNRDGLLQNASKIADLLGIRNVQFIQHEITRDSDFEAVDIVANIGGLYHVSDPEGILLRSYEKANKFLIVQNVVSVATEDENYYEAPAPGWTWGNRYSVTSFHKMMTRLFPEILDVQLNELEGNKRMEDKASIYYLIQK
jgi:hypothetical protein